MADVVLVERKAYVCIRADVAPGKSALGAFAGTEAGINTVWGMDKPVVISVNSFVLSLSTAVQTHGGIHRNQHE
jgi:hypothetical protein